MAAALDVLNERGARWIHRDTMRAMLAAADAAAWQPIESAPPNTSILVFIPGADHYGPAIYRAILVDMGMGRRWHLTALNVGTDLSPEWMPTHWRPLLEPPGE